MQWAFQERGGVCPRTELGQKLCFFVVSAEDGPKAALDPFQLGTQGLPELTPITCISKDAWQSSALAAVFFRLAGFDKTAVGIDGKRGAEHITLRAAAVPALPK